jgi:hypothetical protein
MRIVLQIASGVSRSHSSCCQVSLAPPIAGSAPRDRRRRSRRRAGVETRHTRGARRAGPLLPATGGRKMRKAGSSVTTRGDDLRGGNLFPTLRQEKLLRRNSPGRCVSIKFGRADIGIADEIGEAGNASTPSFSGSGEMGNKEIRLASGRGSGAADSNHDFQDRGGDGGSDCKCKRRSFRSILESRMGKGSVSSFS